MRRRREGCTHCVQAICLREPGARDRLQVIGSSIEKQTEVTLGNIEKILKDAGAQLSDVVQSTVHLSDLTNFSRYDKVTGASMHATASGPYDRQVFWRQTC